MRNKTMSWTKGMSSKKRSKRFWRMVPVAGKGERREIEENRVDSQEEGRGTYSRVY